MDICNTAKAAAEGELLPCFECAQKKTAHNRAAFFHRSLIDIAELWIQLSLWKAEEKFE
ncbi:MAG TPA: hypothetical protein VK136_08430 [Bacillota bacterium]|nr:hypothetical protein [Bacillota bacterium]